MAKLATLVDDFEDNVIDPSLWTADPGVAETGGRIVITPTHATPILLSINTYDATESSIVFDIPQVTQPGISGTAACGVYLRLDPNNIVGFIKTPTDLACQKRVAGVDSTVATFTYNATTMRYWRMRESADIFYWDTSADGTAWTPRFSTFVSTNLFDVTSVGVRAYATYSGADFGLGNMQIESINLPPRITASGSSTSSGSARILITHALTGSAVSTSDGSASIQIHSAAIFSMTASGASTSSGTAMIFRLVPGQLTASGQSFSSGSATFTVQLSLTATAQSFSSGAAELTIYSPPDANPITGYYYFEPPIVYDNPTTLPPPFPQIRNSWAKWQRPQPRGRSVLRYGSECMVIDVPTVDQTTSADAYYAGGHIYIIDNIEAELLSACGLTVTPIPLRFTLFPEETVFPDTDLSPGFRDYILP